MDLADDGEAISVEAFDDPNFPERAIAIELLRHDSRRELLQLGFAAGFRKARVTNVVVNVEFGVVEPDGPFFNWNPLKLLTVSRNTVKNRGRKSLEQCEINASSLVRHGSNFKNLGRGHMHMQVGCFPQEKRRVLA